MRTFTVAARALSHAVLLLVALPSALAASATVSFTLVAEKGVTNTNPDGWAGAVVTLDPPTINESGDVAFRGQTNAAGQVPLLIFGDFGGSTYALSKVLQQGDQIPQFYTGVVVAGDGAGGQGIFGTGISQPLLRDDGQIAVQVGTKGTQSNQYPGGIDVPGFKSVAEQVVLKGQPGALKFIVGGPDYFVETTSLFSYYFNYNGNNNLRFLTQVAMPKTGHDAVAWYQKVINPNGPSHGGGVSVRRFSGYRLRLPRRY